VSRDPIRDRGGANLYAYCGNDPADAIDPAGTAKKSLWQWLKDLAAGWGRGNEPERPPVVWPPAPAPGITRPKEEPRNWPPKEEPGGNQGGPQFSVPRVNPALAVGAAVGATVVIVVVIITSPTWAPAAIIGAIIIGGAAAGSGQGPGAA